MTIDITKLNLPAVSTEGLKALEIIAAAEPNIRELERTILLDPLLASTLIKYANSPLYRRAEKIGNVPAAIRVLGLKNIRNAVVMATMNAVRGSDSPLNRALWGHSVDIAMLCRLIARETYPELADDMEFIGLIHDFGMLVFASSFPQEYAAMVAQSRLEDRAINLIENDTVGLEHDAIIADVLPQFHLPDIFIDLLSGYHHHPPIQSLEHPGEQALAILDLAHHLWLGALPQERRLLETIVEDRAQLQERLSIGDDFIERVLGRYRHQASNDTDRSAV